MIKLIILSIVNQLNMKTNRNLTAIILIVILSGSFAALAALFPGNLLIMGLVFIPLAFMLFNLGVRKSLAYRNYFTSVSNIFTTKFRHKMIFDIPADLMFEKLVEVLQEGNHHKLTLVDMNEEKRELLAITQISMKSWGENVYIDLEEIDGETVLNFCSTTMFQVYDWGKNEKNYDALFEEIENSLTI